MKKDEFLALTDKYLAGTLSQQDELRFLEACEQLQNRTQIWDTALMDDQQMVKDRIFERVTRQVHQAEAHKERPLKTWRYMVAAAAVLCCLFAVYQSRTSLFGQFFTTPMISITAQKGKLLKKQLPDGSSVWLNSESSLTFPEVFADTIREVTLTGEAYFDVTHNRQQPFVIHTENLDTKVLGTRFVVKSYPADAQSKVTLLSGSVAVRPANRNAEALLTPLQELTSDNASGNFTIKINIDSTSAMAWASGKLSYRKQPLGEVLSDLERRFNTRITAEQRLTGCLIYADIVPGDSLEAVLELLAVSLEGKVIENKINEYRITGKGCQ